MHPQSLNNISSKVPQNMTNISTKRMKQASPAHNLRQSRSSPSRRTEYNHTYSLYSVVQQNVVLEQLNTPYVVQPPPFQQCQYSPQMYPQMFCSPYVQPPLEKKQRPLLHPTAREDVNNILTFKPGIFTNENSTTGNQYRAPLSRAATTGNTVLGVVNTTTLQTVGMHSLVRPPNQYLSQHQPKNPLIKKGKIRRYALEIIDPITKRNVLDDEDIEQNMIANVSGVSSAISTSLKSEDNVDTSLDSKIYPMSSSPSTCIKLGENIPESPKPHLEIFHAEETNFQAKVNKTKPVTDDSLKIILNSNELPTANSQQEKHKGDTQDKIKIIPLLLSKEVSNESVIRTNFSEEENPVDSIKAMQVEENANLKLPQQQQEQPEILNKNSCSDIPEAISSIEPTENSISNDGLTNNNKKHEQVEPIFTELKAASIESNDKSDKLHEDMVLKNEVQVGAEKEYAFISPKHDLEDKETADENTSELSSTSIQESASAINSSGTENMQQFEFLIDYNEGQWSPLNPFGKKQYEVKQLMKLRLAAASSIEPRVKSEQIILMPKFANWKSNKEQSKVGSFMGTRESNCQKKKQNSMSGRENVYSFYQNRNSEKPIVHLNLSLEKEVKLSETNNAWRPRILQNSTDVLADPEEKTKREKEELIRRVRGILNKLTPEKFEPLVEEIIKLKIDTMEKMEAIMILVFEKAVDEPHFSVSYALLCQRLISEVKARDESVKSGLKNNLAAFQRSLIDKTEQEFKQNVTNKNAKEEKLLPIREKIKNCSDVNECIELKALFDEEERKIRRRSGGTVRFIGELFKISILTGKIVYNCVEALLKDPNNEDMLECLCKLVTTVGQKLEETRISKNNERKFSLEKIIQQMQSLATKNEKSKISSRLRFMLQDVIDLRKKNWHSNRNEAPKTMEQIEKEAAREQLCATYQYLSLKPEDTNSNKVDDRDIRNADRNYASSRSQNDNNDGFKDHQGRIDSSHSQSGSSTSEGVWQVQTRKRNISSTSNRFK